MSLFIAMVALERAELPEPTSLKSTLRDDEVSQVEHREGVISFTLDGVLINCGLVPAPIPTDELRPILRTSPFWRKDDATLLAHQAHWIVAASGDFEKKQLALTLTKAVAALVKATESAIAVYWGAGSVVTQADIFCEFAAEATLDQLPLYLWIDFRCYSEKSGSSLFTHGMKSLGFMEIEIRDSTESADDTVGLAFNIAHYLLDSGPILKDGDTIGLSAEQRLKISHTKSAHERDETVYRIEVS